MAKQPALTAPGVPAAIPVIDPLGELCAALASTDEGAKKVDARKMVSGMIQRPWQQLPGKLRRAIRADIRRLREAKLSGDAIAAKGYGRTIVDHALRDLGQGGA